MTAVLVTRPAGARDPLVRLLEARGYRVSAVATVVTKPIPIEWPDLARFDWVILTSAAGVASIPALIDGPRWAVVGESTASALRARGIEPEVAPEQANGAALAEAVPDPRAARVLLVRASIANRDLPDRLRMRGAIVEEVTAYETVEGPAESSEPLRAALSQADIAAVVFASGSAVRGFIKLGGGLDLPAITIGPRTTGVARQAGFTVIGEAASQSALELAEAVVRAIPIEVQKDA